MPDDWRNGGFGLYLHWPFCASKCPYCDFNSHVAATIDMDQWAAAYGAELARAAAETGDRLLNSVYFGGGTPSLMSGRLVGSILENVSRHWSLANDLEVTLEANPTSVDASRFADYHAAGVNRVSLGVQALDDADLANLGRLHSVAEALAALDIARSTFDRVNFDLIYARQAQSLAGWNAELRRALVFEPDHLSLYQLTIEDGTAFGDRYRRGRLAGLPSDDLGADMFYLTQELCDAAGLPAYEVSNHAKPGAESRHNLIYWQAGDYVGIGPGAHGRLTLDGRRYATETQLSPAAWLEQVESTGTGGLSRHLLSPHDHAGEYLMMSLRTSLGTDLTRYTSIAGEQLVSGKIDTLLHHGLVAIDGGRLVATLQGRAVLNSVIAALLPD